MHKRGRIWTLRLTLTPSRQRVAVKLDPLTAHLLFRPTDSERVLSTKC